jgi:hypothetical protein
MGRSRYVILEPDKPHFLTWYLDLPKHWRYLSARDYSGQRD